MSDQQDSSGVVSHFSRFDKFFQERILQALLTDKDWAAQMVEVMTPDYFEVKYLRYLTEKYMEHYKRHRTFPTISLLASIVKEDLRDGNSQILLGQIVEYLHKIKFNPEHGDLPQVKEMALDFCRKQAMKEALTRAVDLIETGKHEQVVQIMKDAVAVGIPVSVGHDFYQDMEARFVKLDRRPCPTGLSQLDKLLNGGLGKGELGVIVAPTGVGKSHFLVNFGAHALRMGKNVLHYTFELSETAVGLRYDSNFTDIPSNEIQDNTELVREAYKSVESGRLIIKEYPTGYASTITLKTHIEKLMLKSFVPHLITIDYADIMKSTARYDSLRHELKLVYEELRNMAGELNIPIWTASQANREASDAEVVSLKNMSEAYSKAMVADVVISISRKEFEKATGVGRLFVAKNRAGKDGLLFNVAIDTARSKVKMLDMSDPGEDVVTATAKREKGMKNLLREKWEQVRSESGE